MDYNPLILILLHKATDQIYKEMEKGFFSIFSLSLPPPSLLALHLRPPLFLYNDSCNTEIYCVPIIFNPLQQTNEFYVLLFCSNMAFISSCASEYNICWMLRVKEERHLAYFDQTNSYTSSYQLTLQRYLDKQDKDKSNDLVFKEASLQKYKVHQFFIAVNIAAPHTFEWQSELYKIETHDPHTQFCKLPYSLEAYLELYQDPKIRTFKLTLLKSLSDQEVEELFDKVVGKLIIKTRFRGNPFKLPVNILDRHNLNIEAPKIVTVVIPNQPGESVLCSGSLLEMAIYKEITNFQEIRRHPNGYKLYKFSVEDRVEAENVVVAMGNFKMKELIFDKAVIRIYSHSQDIFFMSTLMHVLQQVKATLGEMESISIVQNMDTVLEDGHRMVFYSDLSSLYKRIYRSVLYDKVRDKWLIEGMINYNRSNKHFQDVMHDLMELMTEGEQLVPLQDPTFHFDRVWSLKATFFYHILSNFKIMRDYGSSSLASLIIEESKKGKITSQVLFRRLKNKYGLKNFRTIYEKQFLESTGISRIFYQIIDLKRENKVKIIVRQKALANKVFKLYNIFRIKLEQQFGIISALTEKIINKNKFLENNNKKKDLSGPLAVPKILNCQPFFRGHVAVETDASEMPFELQLREENIIEEKQNVTSKIRAPVRKVGEADKAYDGFGWMMIDTAHIFPAFYKNENVHQSVILEKVKKKYDSEHEEIKVLNCISSKDHSENQKICKALLDKVKINPNMKENSTINVKRKVLQIVPIFLSKASDFNLWEDMLNLIKLYEPVCHDYSEQGYQFLLGLVESLGDLEYRHQFAYYFEHFHRILLSIFRQLNGRGEDKEQRLKMCIFNTLMKWNSRYSFQILQEIITELKLCRGNIRENLQVLKVIFSNIYIFIAKLKIQHSHPLAAKIIQLTQQIIKNDSTFQLWAIKFKFDLEKKENELQPLEFLKKVFGQIEDLLEENKKKYGLGLEVVKNILNLNKKKWGLEVQLSLKQNQNYFIAEYIWNHLTSQISSYNHFIRLQWIKIYRIFYFFYIPAVSIVKIKKNHETKEFPQLTEDAQREMLAHMKDFFPDIRWFSGYDSRSAKQLKAKYEQENESRRKKKFQEYTFSQNNVITMFVKSHPGRQSWDQLAREAIRIFISIYEDKEQKSEGKEADRCKQIQEGFRKVEQKLKRGRMPDFYNYQLLKQEIGLLMEEYQQNEIRVTDILKMVDKALEEMDAERAKRENQLRDQMRIIINLDSIMEEEQDDKPEKNELAEEGGDDEMIFGYQEQEPENFDVKKEERQDADDDLLMFRE